MRLNNPTAKLWLKTIPKEHLLNLDGKLKDADRDENFVRYEPSVVAAWTKKAGVKPASLPAIVIAHLCRGLQLSSTDAALFTESPFVLPAWAKEALKNEHSLYLFDYELAYKSAIWTAIRRIRDWFDSQPAITDYAELSFEEAAKKADEWGADDIGNPKDWP